MKINIGDIVKVKTIRKRRKNESLLVPEFSDLIGVVFKREIYGWFCKVKFTETMNVRSYAEAKEFFFERCDIVKATDRENFLYKMYGSKAIKKERK